MSMTMTTEQVQGQVPVTVLSLDGELDFHSFESLIDKVQALYDSGTRDLLLDLTDLTFMASSGLVALQSIALIMRGESPPDLENGWGAFRAAFDEVSGSTGPEKHCRLFNPQPRVQQGLDTTGFSKFLSVYDDLGLAVNSF